jgi:hypothetical protein
MKTCLNTSFVILFCFSIFSQSTITELEGKNWIVSATQFEDSSYVVSCQHRTEPSRIILFDKNGNKTISKTVDKKEDWTFSDRPISRYKGGLSVPIIDTESKICYNLFGKDGKLSVTVINENLESETISCNDKMYSKFEGLQEYTAPIATFDSNGDPIWAISQNRRGVLWVKYDRNSKKIEQKFFEHEGYSNVVKGYNYVSATVIGYLEDKVWYAQVTNRGLKEESCTITLYSIDSKLNHKAEKEFKLKKPVKELAMTIKSVDQKSHNGHETMYFTLNTISTNNGGPIKQLWFLSFDGDEVQSVVWENNTGTALYHTEMMVSVGEEEQVRFVIGDDYGNAIAWDVDFMDKAISNISAVQKVLEDNNPKTYDSQSDNWIYSLLLYQFAIEEHYEGSYSEYKPGKTPLAFKGMGNNYFMIIGEYTDNATTLKKGF